MGPKKPLGDVTRSENGDNGNLKADAPLTASLAALVASNDKADTGEKQSSVRLSVSEVDCTILTALIDRTASQKRIIDDLRRVLTQFAVPYRELDPRILEAIRVKLRENITFEEASICVFGTPDHARMIRYWRNRWELQ
jgi:hypothetical protein